MLWEEPVSAYASNLISGASMQQNTTYPQDEQNLVLGETPITMPTQPIQECTSFTKLHHGDSIRLMFQTYDAPIQTFDDMRMSS